MNHPSEQNAASIEKLQQAHDILLANLHNPPPLGVIARTLGLDVNALKSGFCAHYGRSCYCFFLDECIKARTRCSAHDLLPGGGA